MLRDVPKCSSRCSMKRDDVVERMLLLECAEDGGGLDERARRSACCRSDEPAGSVCEAAARTGASRRSLNGAADREAAQTFVSTTKAIGRAPIEGAASAGWTISAGLVAARENEGGRGARCLLYDSLVT